MHDLPPEDIGREDLIRSLWGTHATATISPVHGRFDGLAHRILSVHNLILSVTTTKSTECPDLTKALCQQSEFSRLSATNEHTRDSRSRLILAAEIHSASPKTRGIQKSVYDSGADEESEAQSTRMVPCCPERITPLSRPLEHRV